MRVISGLFLRGINALRWQFDALLWKICMLFPVLAKAVKSDVPVTIGITTFLNRFEIFFKPLVRKLVFLFPGCRIIVVANGSVLSEEQQLYLDELRKFCRTYGNIELIAYDDPRGLSHLWNRIMDTAGQEKALILNDDLRLKVRFGWFIEKSGILNEDIATINSSWSHFLISRKIFSLAGEFDEGLKEIGGEDDDYLARLSILGIRPADFRTGTIARGKKGSKRTPAVNSFGKVMSGEAGGYSTFNTDYLRRKWEISEEYFEGSVEIPRKKYKYWKLKERGGI